MAWNILNRERIMQDMPMLFQSNIRKKIISFCGYWNFLRLNPQENWVSYRYNINSKATAFFHTMEKKHAHRTYQIQG